MLLASGLTITSPQLALAQAGLPLTIVRTCPLVPQLGTHSGTTHQSLITFQEVQSNTAKCQSMALSGQITFHEPAGNVFFCNNHTLQS